MQKIIGLLLVIILSFWSIKSLIGRGYFPMHDDTQVARVIVMGNALKHGQFPVRWVSDLGYGYGYPLYNFYGPLPYYFGGSFYALGADSVMATKWMFGIGTVFAAASMFLLLYPMMGLLAAVTGSVIFLYAPYHAVQIYIRGSVGEYWAIAFIPLILLGIWYIYKNRYTKGLIMSVLGLALTILSHTILGFVTTGILGFSILVYLIAKGIQKQIRKREWYLLVILLLGLGMSAFFWLPALVEMQYTSVRAMVLASTTSFSDHYVCLTQLWNAPWGYGGSAPGCVDGMSFKIGKLYSSMFILPVLLLFFNRSVMRLKKIHTIMILVVVYTIGIIFLTLPYSSIIWNFVPMTSFIQYPWRLLSFVTVGLGMAGAYIVCIHKAPIVRILAAGILVVGSILTNAKLFVPQYQFLRDSYQFETKEELRFRVSKISDEYLPPDIPRPLRSTDIVNEVIAQSPTLTVKEIQKSETFLAYELVSTIPQTLQLKLAYFPGWVFTMNGKEVTPTIVGGLPFLVVSEGRSVVEMKFTNTPIRKVADYVSLIAVAVCIGVFIYGKKTNA